MIIICDLDRTLIPNGIDEYDQSLPVFYDLLSKIKDLTLVYATGRNLELFKEAEKDYGIKKPDYLLASVGTEVYQKNGNEMVVDDNWLSYLKEKQPNWNREEIVKDFDLLIENKKDQVFLQEDNVQNENKISYYLKNIEIKDEILGGFKKYLEEKNINAEVVYSYDPHKSVGLIDVLPHFATKLGAVNYLVQKLNADKENAIYCGDSGNDLLPLTAGFKAVLVKNASDEVKEEAKKIVQEKGFENKLYIAKGNEVLNGNYSSGVIEGLKYFGFLE